MAEQSTRLQVSGHRFLARRMQHALVRADVRMIDDPLRAQALSLTGGTVAALIAVAVCAVLALLGPAGGIGGAPIVVVPQTGALYVTVEDTLHPVPNLASARLVTGSAGDPKPVSQRAVDSAPRGPALGIPGAPAHLAPPLSPEESDWTVCDDRRGDTIVGVGTPEGPDAAPGRHALVAVRGNPAATYLLHDGWRSRVDLRHPAVVRALELDGFVPQMVSQLLLAAVPEAAPIAPPQIPAVGTPGPPALGGLPVGAVFAVDVSVGRQDRYVVLTDGVQRIGQVAADLIRYTDARVGDRMPVLAPDIVGPLPIRTSLAVGTFPDRGGIEPAPVLCARWHADPAVGTSHSTLMFADALPSAWTSRRLAQADGDGPAVDAVAIPSGRSVDVRSVGLTGAGIGSRFLVTDSGMAFGIGDDDAAQRLGLSGPAVPAPWPVLSALPRGPELNRSAASVARDGAP
ncbi:type VII secretion protein EccB [Mycolicibacterium duvalii]|uniref:Type VII secretion protein EccB n=1 Tax=Mycolicibacterium duvalii TaxID=39688 RepID=A0A7I7K4Z6_9MYCO|nr:type VII secretion protein EccB [Mycolicibacterium duvalii]MCV7367957.1 type VII secretion protein EccB [Mycolicibacterium duvalii]PEG39040.1 type VII secretion protein EccB [Mycolicibacterium duvalii]BBX18452.1 type VII secretion protein EccB [Mycolicibacterium duvalii]